MGRTKKVGSSGRLGVRYGTKTRKRIAAAEALKNSKWMCPNCARPKVKRLIAGIWQCSKCRLKFAGRAYKPE